MLKNFNFRLGNKTKKIVTIGGGSGSFMFLSELRKRKELGENLEISAIVAMSDSGGSTGVLRDQYGVLPAGDIRQCLVALSPDAKFLRKLFLYRYNNGFLGGHNFGNIFLSTIEKITGSFEKSIKEAGDVLNVMGKILPISLEKINLSVQQENGKILNSEHLIDNSKIKNYQKIFLKNKRGKKPKMNQNIKKYINEADFIIINPGSFYTSIIPNFLVNDFASLIKKSSAKKIFISNLTTEKGHTNNFFIEDFISELYKISEEEDFIDYVIYNYQKENLPEKVIEAYKKEGSQAIFLKNKNKFPKIKFISENFISPEIFKKQKDGKIDGKLLRHNSQKLVDVILKL